MTMAVSRASLCRTRKCPVILLPRNFFATLQSRALSVSASLSDQKTLAIRRETINAWERRAPLAPEHVRRLVRKGLRVLIQPSNRRAYPIQEYINAGAIAQEDLSEANVIMSVKNVPIDQLISNKTYVFFSHTIKAQKDNMALLDAIIERNIRLIDYEKMVDAKGRRVVAFGTWAGCAGMINILHGLGLRLLALGHHTPFVHIGLAHNYRDSHTARNALREAGYEIALGLMPRSIGPITFVFTGSGNVSQGAQDLFQELPYEYVDVKNLPSVAKHGSLNKVYACRVRRDDHLVRKGGGRFDPDEFDSHPEKYISTFAKTVAPYASVIINGIFYAPNAPRLITIPEAKTLLTPSTKSTPEVAGCPVLPHRLLAICDISADPGGSIEFMTSCTTIDKPFCLYDANQHTNSDSFDSPSGALVCSIDNMPAQMPLEATKYFGDLLYPYVAEIMQSNPDRPLDEFSASPIVKNAVITSNGQLTDNFKYITELRARALHSAHKVSGSKFPATRKALLLGAGFVSGPVVKYLCRDGSTSVTVATALQGDAERITRLSPLVDPVIVDILKNVEKVETLIQGHDIVISLLPYSLHPIVAKMCIKNKVNMVTASYLTAEMKALHDAYVMIEFFSAHEAGITIVNECGLDPGIDHFLAKECFDTAEETGGKITSFVSWCGGLPAPEWSENPLRYKFSWSPKGVLLNTLAGAKYLRDGKLVEIHPGHLLEAVKPVDFMPGFSLEGYPNRDSTIYAKAYGIESAKTLLRGTLRYRGFAEAMKALHAIGLMSTEPHFALDPNSGPELTWKQFLAVLLNQKQDIFVDSLKSLIFDKLGGSEEHFKALDQLDLFSEERIVERQRTPVDALTALLSHQLKFAEGERDIAILRHDIGIRWPDNSEEIQHVDFVAYGEPYGFSAMATTVGYTVAIAADMVLAGEIQKRGMVLPLTKEIYKAMLTRLRKEGLKARIHSTKL